ncbi:MAG: GTPase HflX [bacterium]
MIKAVLIGVITPALEKRFEYGDPLEELASLSDTLGIEVARRVIQKLGKPNHKFYLGKGKVLEVKALCEEVGADWVIANDELSSMQRKNLEDALEREVKDRTRIILDIFAARARSKEGKLQVEMASLIYERSRLVGKGIALSRLGGGVGTRGPGETQLEYDRSHIDRRIATLRKELKRLQRQRQTQRKGREIPVVALIGYTNVGKSTLFNALTEAEALVDDKLFATLDPLTRRIKLPNREDALVTDTVGFISNLPHQLIEAFRATLEELSEADLLIHVVDASHPRAEEQMADVYKILEELKVNDKPIITVANKADKNEEAAQNIARRCPNGLAISALERRGIEELLERITDLIYARPRRAEVLIPYGDGLPSLLHKKSIVLKEEYTPEGVRMEVQATSGIIEEIRRMKGVEVTYL